MFLDLSWCILMVGDGDLLFLYVIVCYIKLIKFVVLIYDDVNIIE